MVFASQVAVTPKGKPVAVPIPVAPEVVKVIGVKVALIHNVAVLEVEVIVLLGFTIILPVANNVLQPPVNGML